MRIIVLDGMGGGLGSQIISRIRHLSSPTVEIIALGANAIATAAMMKAGATIGATGENAILVNVPRADVILGPIGIAIPHSLLGEITPGMAAAVALSNARKILIPVKQTHGHFELAGVDSKPLAASLDDLVMRVIRVVNEHS